MRILGEPWAPRTGDIGGASSRGPHRLMAALRCEALWAYRYHKRIVPIHQRQETLHGTVIHTEMQFRNANLRVGGPPKWARGIDPVEEVDLTANQKPSLADDAREACDEYEARYAAKKLPVIDVEIEVFATLGEMGLKAGYHADEVVTARLDLVEERKDDRLQVRDLKSVGRTDLKDYVVDPYARSLQVLLGLRIARAHYAREGREVAAFVIDRISRPKSKKTGRRSFLAHPVTISPEAYREAGETAVRAVLREFEIVDRIESKRGVRQEGVGRDLCYTQFGPCDYRRICDAKPSKRSAIVDLHFGGRKR